MVRKTVIAVVAAMIGATALTGPAVAQDQPTTPNPAPAQGMVQLNVNTAVDQTLVDNVRVLGARGRDVTRHVLLPAAFSAIVASLRTSAGFAFAGAVVAEYIGSNAGVGRRIATAEAFFDSTGVFGGIVLIALLALVLDALLQVVEAAFSRWKPRRES